MRSSYGSIRFLCLAVLPLLLSCAAAPPERTARDALVLDGEITIVHGAPIEESVQLTDVDGDSWVLTSLPLGGDLLRLGGHRVRVWGRVASETATVPMLVVDRYEMLPVDGMIPVIGIIAVGTSQVILSAHATGERYELTGPLRGALVNFPGCRAWVWGVPMERKETPGGRMIEVRGYGILGPAAGATAPAPADTIRN